MKLIITIATLFILTISISGCSLFGSGKKEVPPTTPSSTQQPATPTPNSTQQQPTVNQSQPSNNSNSKNNEPKKFDTKTDTTRKTDHY